MAIKDIIEFIGQENIADDILESEGGKQKLSDLGQEVKRRFDEDWQSMHEWMDSVDHGVKLMKQEFNTKSTPWDGASNFKSPILSEASISFGDKATLEILRPRNLVKSDIIGRDLEGKKKELSERVTEAMNYQVNYGMEHWRDDQETMLYVLPNVGCIFKKTVFDPLEGKTASHIIEYPNFAINQSTRNMETCRSFTQILDVDLSGANMRIEAGVWSDVELYPKDAEGDEGSNEAAGTLHAEDNPDRFLEQHCFADLDDDGIDEPYIITIHENTMTIVRIVARFDKRSFMVKTEQGQIMNLVDVIGRDTVRAQQAGEELPETVDLTNLKLIRIEPVKQITKYGFIPSPNGTFLDLGYAHLLGAITQGVNTTTNQLTDAGTLRNTGGGFLAKGFRKKMGPMKLKIGQYQSTEIAAKDLQNGIMPNPSPEPSPTLFALNEKLEQQGRNFAAIVDAGGQITANTAPTTALALIQESLISTSALMGRVIKGMSKEYQIIFKLNQTTFDPEANALLDFNNQTLDIKPTASPEMSSKLQRIQLSDVEMSQIPMVIQAGGNPAPIVKNFYERIGSDNVDEIFPEEPSTAEQAEIARFADAQELENQIQQQQLQLSELQTEILMREQDRLDAETKIKIEKAISDITKNMADNILTLEKAETEDTKNQISKYTAQNQATLELLTAIGAENDRASVRRNERAAQQASSIPGSVS